MTVLQNTVKKAATDALLDALERQPWYRRYANTITMVATGIVTFGTWFATTRLEVPPVAQAVIGGLVFVASVIAARATKNGITPRGNRDVIDAITPEVTDAVKTEASETVGVVVDAAGKTIGGVVQIGVDAAIGTVGNIINRGVSEAERVFLGR